MGTYFRDRVILKLKSPFTVILVEGQIELRNIFIVHPDCLYGSGISDLKQVKNRQMLFDKKSVRF